MSRKITLVALVILLVAVSFLRESFFLEANRQIDYRVTGYDYSSDALFSGFLMVFDAEKLSMVKWCATVFFILVFLALTIFIIRYLFNSHSYHFMIVLIFTGTVLIASLSILLGKVIPSLDTSTYYFSRWMLGAMQSPLMTAILGLLIYYHRSKRSE